MKIRTLLSLLLLSGTLAASEGGPSWSDRVTAARAIDDPDARAEAMLLLVREALPGREVRLSGNSDPEHVVPSDNEAAPVVNFDPHLQQKRSARPRSGGATRSLANNFGYYFSKDGVGYVVIGPAALDPRSPAFTVLAAEHELFHAENHVGDGRPMNDRELETWSTMFVEHFDEIHPFRQRWAPMLHYYAGASAREQEAAVERLVEYYRAPMTTDVERTAFDTWLARRKKDSKPSPMIAALEEALGGQ